MVGAVTTVVGLVGAIAFGIWLAILRDAFHVWDGWVIAAIVLWVIAAVALWRSFAEHGKPVEKARALVAAGQTSPSAELTAANRAPTGLLFRAFASITISTIATEARTRSRRPVEERFAAVRSALGPVWPAAMSARAFSTGFAYSTKERHNATAAITHKTIAAITQPSHGRKSIRKIASQIPKAIAPTSPTTVVTVATIPTRLRASVSPGVWAERSETTTIHDITSEPTSVAALSR
jgi:hypothetical protein